MSASPQLSPVVETAGEPTYGTGNDLKDPYFSTLYSIGRVTVAGFGGALAGLSFARRGGSAAAAGRQVASTLAGTAREAKRGSNATLAKVADKKIKGGNKSLRRQRPVIRNAPPSTRPYVDRELPYAWAVACTAFAGIIEFARVVSPVSCFREWMRREFISDVEGNHSQNGDNTKLKNVSASHQAESGRIDSVSYESLDSYLVTMSDYAIGGAIAGALFRGSAVRTQIGSRLDASILGASAMSNSTHLSTIKGRPFSGVFRGAALGWLAGVVIVMMEHAQVVVEHYFRDSDSIDNAEAEGVDLQREKLALIPADIKAMSNEELRRSIENITRGRSEAYNENENSKERQADESPNNETPEEASPGNEVKEDRKVRDLIYALGFRPHPSQ